MRPVLPPVDETTGEPAPGVTPFCSTVTPVAGFASQVVLPARSRSPSEGTQHERQASSTDWSKAPP
jgi:hypothetical protein